ncbi:MAG TPA: BON domain-containing protein, partial [Candidatus Binatia bacterium]|nr:BON domain-containing protein [Candidatus Binatia bacterium]
LAVIILASTVLYSQQSGSLAALGVNIDQLVSVPWKNPSPAKSKQREAPFFERLPDERALAESHAPPPGIQVPELSGSFLDSNSAAAIKSDIAQRPPTPPTEANNLQPESSIASASDQLPPAAKNEDEARTFVHFSDTAVAAERLEFEVYKAIHNRAIRTVNVSITDGTVYLTGRVATERQKLAAAQAALSVRGIKEVRNQVIVSFPTLRDGGS